MSLKRLLNKRKKQTKEKKKENNFPHCSWPEGPNFPSPLSLGLQAGRAQLPFPPGPSRFPSLAACPSCAAFSSQRLGRQRASPPLSVTDSPGPRGSVSSLLPFFFPADRDSRWATNPVLDGINHIEDLPNPYKASSPPRGFPLAPKLTHPHPSRLGRSVSDLAGDFPAAAHSHTSPLALSPSKASGWTRDVFLYLPMVSVLLLVLGNTKPRSSDELEASGHGAQPWRSLLRWGGQSTLPQTRPKPSDPESTPEIRK